MTLILEFLNFFFQFMLFVALFGFLRGMFKRAEAELDKEIDTIKDKVSKMIHFIKTEKHGDMIYWFDLQSDEFLGQGLTEEAVIDSVKARFPTHIFINEDADKFMRGPDWKLKPITELTKEGAITDVPRF